MAAIIQLSRTASLTDVPPELLRKIVDLCADDVSHGRTALLNLSVMNKYIRKVAEPRVFTHIFFRDRPQSPGDEFLQTIRRFMRAPGLCHHARTVTLCLNRVKCLGSGHATYSEPYHYLVLPELVEALVAMPNVMDLAIQISAGQGRVCLHGLQTAVRWGTARKALNIRSLTVSTEIDSTLSCECEEVWNNIDFLAAFPQLNTLCFEGSERVAWEMNFSVGDCLHPTMASKLTQLRLYKTSSDPRSGFQSSGWRIFDIESHKSALAMVVPELEYLSILGELRGFPVSDILEILTDIPKLKYVDITDEQIFPGYGLNEDRSMLAQQTFEECAQLRRICFVRCAVGEVYLRGYGHAVAKSTGYVSRRVSAADLCNIPTKWRYGVPQMSSMPFPTFTPWEGRFRRKC